jgi:L-alanine-DL-glutamate epimerase-like enolase superfamily enzyme
MTRRVAVTRDSFPIRGSFRISRGAKTAAEVVVVEIGEGGHRGRGECVPYTRYGETVEGVMATLQELAPHLEAGRDRAGLLDALPAGAARNAVDCALWDLEAKRSGQPVWRLAGLTEPPQPVTTVYTLSLDTVEAMGQAARAAAQRPILKLKLTGDGDLERVRAVRANAPAARLVVDANEGWSLRHLAEFSPEFAALGVELIEQPLPAGDDEMLRGLACPVPLGADESFHDHRDIERLRGLYQVLNVKLDKTGGLTEALSVKRAAEQAGFAVMVGCMLATSLAMAPAVLLAQGAAFVDLDGPLLLAEDRVPGLTYDGSQVFPPLAELWG